MSWYMNCAKKTDLVILKSHVGESGIGKLKKVFVDLSKLINLAKNDVVNL